MLAKPHSIESHFFFSLDLLQDMLIVLCRRTVNVRVEFDVVKYTELHVPLLTLRYSTSGFRRMIASILTIFSEMNNSYGFAESPASARRSSFTAKPYSANAFLPFSLTHSRCVSPS